MRKSSVLVTALASVILLSGGSGFAQDVGSVVPAAGSGSHSVTLEKNKVTVEQIDISRAPVGTPGYNRSDGGSHAGSAGGSHSKVASNSDSRGSHMDQHSAAGHGTSGSMPSAHGYRAKNGRVYSLSASKSDYAAPNGCPVPGVAPSGGGRGHGDMRHHGKGKMGGYMPWSGRGGGAGRGGMANVSGASKQNAGRKPESDSNMPKITLSGAVNAALFVRKDEGVYDIGKFDQYRDAALNANYSGAISDSGYFRYHDFNYGNYHDEYNVAADAVLKLKAEKTIPSFGGLTFGGEVGLALIGLSQDSTVLSTGIRDASRGVDVFLSSEYGKLSVGYQDGVESMFRIDADKLEAGSLDTQGIYWYRYVNLEGRDRSSPFYLTPGLFSETFNNGTNHVSARIDKFNLAVGKSRLAGYLPFRVNYVTPDIGGFKLGVSYSPGYRKDSFTGPYYKPPVRLSIGSLPYYSGIGLGPKFPIVLRDIGPDEQIIGPAYKNVFSGALSYRFSLDRASSRFPHGSYIEAAVVGEMGKQSTIDDLGYDIAGAFMYEDLKAFAIGAKASLSGFMLAGSYGNMFRSGLIKTQYTSRFGSVSFDSQYTGPYFQPGSIVPDHFANVSSNDYSGNTTYYSVGAGYEVSKFYIGATYFRSKVHDSIMFSDFSLGAQYTFTHGGPAYNLFTRGTSLVPYVVWHYFKTDQPDSSLISAVPALNNSGLANRVTGYPYPALNNSGSMIMAGAKFVF